ncbi:ATP-binding protein [Ileibacterium valens]|uniref:ATP-binding protein n=1 Tax=Ileibacterium valens TaxID=1862668 RepID=UPI0024BB67AE|nr:ATP-binding protein [Ileibacterium valens]
MLEAAVRSELGLEQLGSDAQKSLGIQNLSGNVTISGVLLSDQNSYPGIDLVSMDNEDIFGERLLTADKSLLTQLDQAMEFFRRYYCRDMVTGSLERKKVYLVPEQAFRESIVNALVHRQWDISADILLKMYPDRMQVNSPGGLPYGITKEDYLYRDISVPRNFTITNLFLRLGLIEKLGTGIHRIIRSYSKTWRRSYYCLYSN